jgi:hypothetical protein
MDIFKKKEIKMNDQESFGKIVENKDFEGDVVRYRKLLSDKLLSRSISNTEYITGIKILKNIIKDFDVSNEEQLEAMFKSLDSIIMKGISKDAPKEEPVKSPVDDTKIKKIKIEMKLRAINDLFRYNKPASSVKPILDDIDSLEPSNSRIKGFKISYDTTERLLAKINEIIRSISISSKISQDEKSKYKEIVELLKTEIEYYTTNKPSSVKIPDTQLPSYSDKAPISNDEKTELEKQKARDEWEKEKASVKKTDKSQDEKDAEKWLAANADQLNESNRPQRIKSEVSDYNEALEQFFLRLDFWVRQEQGDQEFRKYAFILKDLIKTNFEAIKSDAEIYSISSVVVETAINAVSTNIQGKLKVLYDSLPENPLKYFVKAVIKYFNNNKEKIGNMFNTPINENKEVITNRTASQGSEDSNTQGGKPTPEQVPDTDNFNEPVREEVEVIIKNVGPGDKVPEVVHKKSTLYSKEKKDFIWYKDTNSKTPTEVKRDEGVKGSGITEFTPTKTKMDVTNPVEREEGVSKSEITDFKVSEDNKVEMAIPVEREEGVSNAPKEFIKFEENRKYQENIKLIFRAIKESKE